ncbi:penicillin-binding transpeptidase domain-containing protein [Streptomyces sp. DSM 44917]|uniref:Penicillin-binding transpeptidase domain-containing protein n=1 Tax=Streptomyces boetiae TaxID=3075541 RepID=A0ABU2LBY3_9ACTN|nr:penicillin-binding transpeptidase domain-containing protein [Streptomyces sp. DSM 44917]MDT0309096.1 penicillin-binding transpeptidase domain-containing protein [Streptomyces sp. DSM 44917]
MGNGQRVAVVSGVCAAVVSVAGLGAWSLLGGDEEDGPTRPVAATSEDRQGGGEESPEAGPPDEREVLETSGAFLEAWASGDLAAAAELTDDPEAARAALGALVEDAALARVTVRPGAPDGARVPFALESSVSWEDQPAVPLAWDSELTVVRDEAGDGARVAWQPSLLHPELAEGARIETGPDGEAPPVEALDANGEPLDAEALPSLAPLIEQLRERYEEEAGGTPAVSTRIVDAEGETVATLAELAEAEPGRVPTTIDPALQRAAQAAIDDAQRGAVVAVEPSTGAIRAVANAPADGFDTALQGSYAPGSTFKIVSSSLLIDRDLASPDRRHPCPRYFTHGGWRFQNDDEFDIPNGTFADSFARSCNTAFISQAPELSDDDLGNHARDVFGLGLNWQVGVTTMDGRVPTQSDAQMAASLIGQGAVRMNPLNMASVSATVQSGTFRQPYLVPADFDGRELAQAPGSLSAEAAGQLRALMNRAVTNGTATQAMAGLGGNVGAKTGSAEVDGQENPNAWFTAFRDDLAVAAVVPDSGHGGEFAGPVVADVLRAAG